MKSLVITSFRKLQILHFSPFRFVFLVVFLLVSLSCTPDHPQSTFDVAGPIAKIQLDLFMIIFWISIAIFIVVEAALIYAAVKFRYKPGQDLPKPVHGNKPMEIAWTIAPILVLIVIAVLTIQAIVTTSNSPDPDGIKVEVIGHQWWWEFRYPDYGIVTANELHMPVDKVINLTLRSDDVLHSFWIPKLAGKVDVISTLPGQTNSMWIKGDREGIFWGLCAEFCGIAHTHMKFQAIVESQTEFDSWVANYNEASATVLDSEGAKLFSSKGCTQCHSTQGPPKFDQIGPNLTLFGTRGTLAAGMLENNDHNLEKWLLNPNDVKEGNLMYREAPVYQNPNMKLTDSEILSLVNYLRNLK